MILIYKLMIPVQKKIFWLVGYANGPGFAVQKNADGECGRLPPSEWEEGWKGAQINPEKYSYG